MLIMCGPWGIDECTPERLFDYFGNNFLAPFNITYVYGNENTTAPVVEDPSQLRPIYPFNVETHPCNSSDSNYTCRCIDCEEACPAPPEAEPPPAYHYVGSMRVYVFVLIMIFIVFSLCLIGIALVIGLPGKEEEEIKLCVCNQQLSAKFENKLSDAFQFTSKHVAYHPYIVAIVAIILIVVMSCGIIILDMTTDPVELWASPESRTRKEKDYFDQHFGPFYRTNQILITSIGFSSFEYGDYEMGPVFNSTFLEEVFKLQDEIFALTAEYDGRIITLEDVCIKPLSPQNNYCLIQTIYNYFQNDLDYFNQWVENGDYLEHITTCLNNPSYSDNENTTCMGTFGGPVFPYVAVGGFLDENETIAANPNYEQATALVISILNQNYDDKDKLGPALAWEKKYLDFLKEYSNPFMDIAYYAERSIQDEIERESKSDVSTILISYFVMFAYVAISLGNFNTELGRVLIETKMTLGLCSVILVFLSVVSSIGLCGFLGVQGTLFVLEVIPFLVLAVGVDNIFLLVQTLQREERSENETVEEHVAKVVGKVAPSMLIATSSEVVCFFLGALSDMPAVHSFSLFAGVALAIDFLLQITCLVAFIVIDAKRKEANRYDVLCCLKKKEKEKISKPQEDLCMSFFKHFYAPFLFNDIIRVTVIIIFVGGFIASCCYIPKMDIGLEQDIGMPDDSYVIKYFEFMGLYLSVGAPIYFVMKEGFNFPNIDEQNIICQTQGCNEDSVLARIFYASEAPDVTSVATGPTSWIDGYFSWITDSVGRRDVSQACCRLDDNGNFINSSAPSEESARRTCLRRNDLDSGRPKPEHFMEYLPDFLIDNPHGTICPQAGHPSYGSAVVIKDKGCVIPANETSYDNSSCVGANNFMAYNTILKNSRDFTNALQNAYDLTDQLNEYIRNNSATPDVEMFPYSIFYVYYEQYLDMWPVVGLSLSVSLISVFLVMLLVTGFDFRSTLINVVIIIMIVVDIMGLMVPWNIQLNAISLVNLVMAIGISVEFCSHLSHAFSLCPYDTKIERAKYSLIYTGSSVLSGITLTKFAGIIILAFASSQVITVFYFRMYLMIVLLGAAHGLILLPVLLSIIGPPTNPYIKIAFQNMKKHDDKNRDFLIRIRIRHATSSSMNV
ncbi:Niemann-Pick C1 protein [Armadillidium nasatum]|uniref:Niemann-Pick C1 protein n=1 Tax=Armadillidium nasatum TaxID=96803 RepID=A0A5N5SME8_9CRUS|nr:Niemann-Pick C1 protein [Armadillidium nasatum]